MFVPVVAVKAAQEALTDMPPRSEQVRTHATPPLVCVWVCVCGWIVFVSALPVPALQTTWREKQLKGSEGGDVGVKAHLEVTVAGLFRV